MSPQFKDQDGVLIVMPAKRLDTGSAPEVEKEVMARIEGGSTRIVFDFVNTDYVSSAGLRVVLRAAKSVKRSGGGVALCRTNTHIKEVLELSGFEMVVTVTKTLDKAIAAV